MLAKVGPENFHVYERARSHTDSYADAGENDANSLDPMIHFEDSIASLPFMAGMPACTMTQSSV